MCELPDLSARTVLRAIGAFIVEFSVLNPENQIRQILNVMRMMSYVQCGNPGFMLNVLE